MIVRKKSGEKHHPRSRVGIGTEELFFGQQHQKHGADLIIMKSPWPSKASF